MMWYTNPRYYWSLPIMFTSNIWKEFTDLSRLNKLEIIHRNINFEKWWNFLFNYRYIHGVYISFFHLNTACHGSWPVPIFVSTDYLINKRFFSVSIHIWHEVLYLSVGLIGHPPPGILPTNISYTICSTRYRGKLKDYSIVASTKKRTRVRISPISFSEVIRFRYTCIWSNQCHMVKTDVRVCLIRTMNDHYRSDDEDLTLKNADG